MITSLKIVTIAGDVPCDLLSAGVVPALQPAFPGPLEPVGGGDAADKDSPAGRPGNGDAP